MNSYLIILEKTATGFSAYSPDIPGCIATGSTREMHDSIEFHLEGLKRLGNPIPVPSSTAAYCEVAA